MSTDKTASDWPRSIIVTLNDVLSFFHIENFANASDEEAIFLFRLYFRLSVSVKILAREANGKADHIASAVMLAMAEKNEGGIISHENSASNA